MEVASCSENIELPDEVAKEAEETSSSSSETASNSDSQENKTDEQPAAKRRRKRKRKPKKKKVVIAAYEPEDPFPARYNNLPAFLNYAAPKVHLRFDTEGNEDGKKSEFNYKPRIIKALLSNLSLCENLNQIEKEIDMDVTLEVPALVEEIISRKPRIIKALSHVVN